MAAAVDDVPALPPMPPMPLLLRRLLLEDERETRPRNAAPANAKSTAELFLCRRPPPPPPEESPPGAADAAADAEEGREEALALRALA